MRRGPSIGLITSMLLASAVAIAPSPAFAADVTTDPPATIANNVSAGQLTFTVGSAHALSLTTLASAEVDLTGPTGSDAPFTFKDTSAGVQTAPPGTVTATLDMTKPGPLAPPPGSYTASIIKNPDIGSSSTLDTATVTVTNPQPTLSASVSLFAGQADVAFSVTASSNFATGDTLSFTNSDGDPVSGLTFSDGDLQSKSFSGKINSTRAVTPGAYDITVTDAVGGTAVCTGCVNVDPGTGIVSNLHASSISHTSATLSWTAPAAGPGVGPEASGYTVFVSTDPEPTSNDSGVTVAQTGTDPNATVSGLSPGTQYYVSVIAASDAGPGDATTASFFTGEPSALTVAHTDLHLKYGQRLTLSGHLSGNNIAQPDQSIVLYSKVGTAAAKSFATVRTDGSGNYSYTFAPAHNATYFARYAGATGAPEGPAVDAAQSAKIKGTVAQAITLKGAAVHHFKWLQLTGKVGPSAAGRTVVIYNKKNGHLKKYASAKLSPKSTYKLVLKHVRSGRYRLYAKIAATPVNLAGISRKLPVRKP